MNVFLLLSLGYTYIHFTICLAFSNYVGVGFQHNCDCDTAVYQCLT